MQVFYSEYIKDYSTYTFGYTIYALQEENDSLSDLYTKGFLPYTGDYNNEDEIYYLARSTRVDLEYFSLSSENRRILRKIEDSNVEVRFIPKSEFDLMDSAFLSFCLNYAMVRYRNGSMTEERFRYVSGRDCATHIATFRIDDKTVAYLLAGIDQDSLHFWFSFYDTTLMSNFPVGKWIMLETIRWAKEQNKQHVYLGTCYGAGALYKVRDFKGVQFFDGKEWRDDIATLKDWCKNDASEMKTDRFKLS